MVLKKAGALEGVGRTYLIQLHVGDETRERSFPVSAYFEALEWLRTEGFNETEAKLVIAGFEITTSAIR